MQTDRWPYRMTARDGQRPRGDKENLTSFLSPFARGKEKCTDAWGPHPKTRLYGTAVAGFSPTSFNTRVGDVH